MAALHHDYMKKGCYVFAPEGYRARRQVDRVAILPTTDKYQVIAAIQVDGSIDTGRIIQRLRELEKIQPFILTGIGHDFLAGKFTTPINDPADIAKRMYEICPEIGNNAREGLAKRMPGKPEFYFWWD